MSQADLSSESKAYPGQSGRLPTNRVGRWFAFAKRGLGMAGFVLNRVAGLGLLLYLLIHLVVLSLLTLGPEGWDSFIELARSPLFLTLDVILLAGVIGHGLNGLRVALIGNGLLVPWQHRLLIVLAVVGVILWVVAAVLIYRG